MPNLTQGTIAPSGGSDDVIGFRKDVFFAILKHAAIAGAVAGAINFVGGILMTLFSWFGIFAIAGGTMLGVSSIFTLFREVIEGAFWGIASAILVVKIYDKLPFNTLFMKIFGIRLIIDILVSVVFGGLVLIFVGPLSFGIMVVTFIVADYVYAKMIASKIGPLVGLR